MKSHAQLMSELQKILEAKLGARTGEFLLPPPSFETMQGELLEMNLDAGTLSARFPVLENYLNPYHSMLGGMIAAAVDNTIGPLSFAVAPPNVTRRLEMKYSRPVTLEMGYIVVQARLVERDGRQLVLEARVSSPDGGKLATCRAVHYVIDLEP